MTTININVNITINIGSQYLNRNITKEDDKNNIEDKTKEHNPIENGFEYLSQIGDGSRITSTQTNLKTNIHNHE